MTSAAGRQGLVWFILRPCQHDNGYIGGRPQIEVHTDERTGSQRSVFPDGHPSKYLGLLTEVDVAWTSWSHQEVADCRPMCYQLCEPYCLLPSSVNYTPFISRDRYRCIRCLERWRLTQLNALECRLSAPQVWLATVSETSPCRLLDEQLADRSIDRSIDLKETQLSPEFDALQCTKWCT